MNLICITDGVPTDDVESPLIACAKKLDKLEAPAWQVGVQFFQVGNDKVARKSLVQLDDELKSIAGDDEMTDMIDRVPFGSGAGHLTGDGMLKVMLGAVTSSMSGGQSITLRGQLLGIERLLRSYLSHCSWLSTW